MSRKPVGVARPRIEAEPKRHVHTQHRIAITELERAVRGLGGSPSDVQREVLRRKALMGLINQNANRHHPYRSRLDPLGTICDSCWAPIDAWQHLLHPRASLGSTPPGDSIEK